MFWHNKFIYEQHIQKIPKPINEQHNAGLEPAHILNSARYAVLLNPFVDGFALQLFGVGEVSANSGGASDTPITTNLIVFTGAFGVIPKPADCIKGARAAAAGGAEQSPQLPTNSEAKIGTSQRHSEKNRLRLRAY